MGKTIIKIEDFTDVISRMLDDERKKVIKQVDRVLEETADETCTVVKQEATLYGFKKRYVNSIKVNKEKNGRIYKVSSTGKHTRLTHLLEDGHKTVKSHGKYGKAGKTRAFPHFTAGAEYADWRLEQLAKELVNED